jgi:hypothetical protein
MRREPVLQELAVPPWAGLEGARWSRALTTCLRGLAPALERPPAGTPESDAFELLVRLAGNGRSARFLRAERPAWLGEQRIATLLAECDAQRREQPVIGQHYVKCGAEAARLAAEDALVAWLTDGARQLGASEPTDMALTYIDYRDAGDSCPVHVDRIDAYALNCLICLRHTAAVQPPGSRLRIFGADGGDFDLLLAPGERILLPAAMVPHGRTPVVAGERVTLLSIGLR